MMRRKPPKRVDPLVELKDMRIPTTLLLRLLAYSEALQMEPELVIRCALAQHLGTLEPR